MRSLWESEKSVLLKEYCFWKYFLFQQWRLEIISVQFGTEAGITRSIFYWISCPFFINFKIDFLGIVDHKNPLHYKLDYVKEKKIKFVFNTGIVEFCGTLANSVTDIVETWIIPGLEYIFHWTYVTDCQKTGKNDGYKWQNPHGKRDCQ